MNDSQVFCAAPIDQNSLTGDQYCVNYVVGYRSPELVQPFVVQGERYMSAISTHLAPEPNDHR